MTTNAEKPQPKQEVASSTIICSYILCFLMPFAGFFAGIYLWAKGKAGHGITCIALSLVVGAIIAFILLD